MSDKSLQVLLGAFFLTGLDKAAFSASEASIQRRSRIRLRNGQSVDKGKLAEVIYDEEAVAYGLFKGGILSNFKFEGGAATYWGTAILAGLITILTAGILYPFALVLMERWRAKHSYIDGRRLEFFGSAIGLFGRWILWFLLIIVTLGIYSLWVAPRIAQWKWEHTRFAA